MYRNTYLELYKNSASHEQNPTVLLTHFSQIYNTLGCVLQDLEYHIGRMQLQNSKLLVAEEPHKENEQSNAVRRSKGRSTEREVIKIENSVNDPPIKKDRNSDKSVREPMNTSKKMQYGEEAVKYESSEPRMEVTKANKYHQTPARQVQPERTTGYGIGEKARTGSNRQSDSFDELFGGVQEQRIDSSQPKLYPSNLAPIPQNHSENENSQPPNTYDDFMERIFKQTESRRRK